MGHIWCLWKTSKVQGGKRAKTATKKMVVDHMDACTVTGWRSRRLLDCTGLSTLPAPFPPIVPERVAGRAQQRGAAARLGCVHSGAESCSARATRGRVGITPCAEHLSPFTGKGEHPQPHYGAERGAVPTLPVGGRGGSWPCHHQNMATLCSHTADPQRTHPYPDGQSRDYLCQLQVLTEHRSSLANWVNEQQTTPSKTKHRHKW